MTLKFVLPAERCIEGASRVIFARSEVRARSSGQTVANLSVTKARFTDRSGAGQKQTKWHRVVAFGKNSLTTANACFPKALRFTSKDG